MIASTTASDDNRGGLMQDFAKRSWKPKTKSKSMSCSGNRKNEHEDTASAAVALPSLFAAALNTKPSKPTNTSWRPSTTSSRCTPVATASNSSDNMKREPEPKAKEQLATTTKRTWNVPKSTDNGVGNGVPSLFQAAVQTSKPFKVPPQTKPKKQQEQQQEPEQTTPSVQAQPQSPNKKPSSFKQAQDPKPQPKQNVSKSVVKTKSKSIATSKPRTTTTSTTTSSSSTTSMTPPVSPPGRFVSTNKRTVSPVATTSPFTTSPSSSSSPSPTTGNDFRQYVGSPRPKSPNKSAKVVSVFHKHNKPKTPNKAVTTTPSTVATLSNVTDDDDDSSPPTLLSPYEQQALIRNLHNLGLLLEQKEQEQNVMETIAKTSHVIDTLKQAEYENDAASVSSEARRIDEGEDDDNDKNNCSIRDIMMRDKLSQFVDSDNDNDDDSVSVSVSSCSSSSSDSDTDDGLFRYG
eukprot:CAMPEP_0178843762 /NCGR_PEP_ID=MMETSP0746-20121128/16368_1 /TAXON_ID=913974 /ORGANISM="Nitzschia punctata, Strain CCMP561" /LENGTH=460 /DNA_ID=CAMNT_0020507495 /DNA_START=9 /DNA_END=1391 /DNA_ORIENTATION=+